ncbi:histone-fold-containing protein [Cylindrobasidium torrendii FP15055 ss-10]|uniref:Histone H2A n=1 Tax=Cylindrobasidium torrendii FP15055 ss-10 TaxID=1314674 RepID=A0A0D7B029_9AGAR|nr:histone-fold-containing protein [Cylindrobasidium torrendii FP15055 ss-10]
MNSITFEMSLFRTVEQRALPFRHNALGVNAREIVPNNLGRGKNLAGTRGKSAPSLGRLTKSYRAGLAFPVARVHRKLKNFVQQDHIRIAASIFLTAVLEYLVAEVTELAGNAARDHRKQRIIPRFLQLAIRNDDELDKLLDHVFFPNSGVVPGSSQKSDVETKLEKKKPLACEKKAPSKSTKAKQGGKVIPKGRLALYSNSERSLSSE